jgi:hypothetical protein
LVEWVPAVEVENGLFNIDPSVRQSYFDGRELWIEVQVGNETLTPRQEILPVPYALSLRPGAVISGSVAGKGVLNVNTPGSGEAVYGSSSSGKAVYGRSGSGDGVHGYSISGRGVFGSSGSGTGVWGSSIGGKGVHGTSNSYYGGYFYSYNYRGLYATSHENYYAGYFVNRGGSAKPGTLCGRVLSSYRFQGRLCGRNSAQRRAGSAGDRRCGGRHGL